MKKICFMLALMFCSLLFLNVFAISEPEMEMPMAISSLSLCEKETNAIKKYNLILREWAFDPEFISDTNANFPEFYGGTYINDDKLFVIQITNSFEEARKYFSEIIDLTDVAFERVQYSFVELKEAQDEIEKIIHSTKISSFDDYDGIGISSSRNKVIVLFGSKSSASKAARMSGLTRSDIVEFVEMETFVKEETQGKNFADVPNSLNDENIALSQTSSITVAPGDKIYHVDSVTYATGTPRSVGYWAYDSAGNLGIVTAPHNSIKANDIIFDDESDVIIGVAGTPYSTGTTVDAVFVPCPGTNANSSTDTRIYASRAVSGWEFLLSSDTNLLTNGATVYALGSDTGCMMGTVLLYNQVTSSGVRDCVLTSCVGDYGDSGGIVAGEGTSSVRDIAGIMTAMRSSDNYVYYVKAENINNTLGLDAY